MRILSSPLLILLAALALAACLPQGVQTGSGGLSGAGAVGASGEDKADGVAEKPGDDLGWDDAFVEGPPPAAGSSANGPAKSPPPADPKSPSVMMAENTQGGMFPSGQLAPEGIVGEDGQIALVQGTQANVCRIGGNTQVNVSGRVALLKEGQAEPDAFHPGPLRFRVYYRKDPGSRLLAYEENGFLDEMQSVFWRAQASVLTADPASVRFSVFDPLAGKVYALPSYLDVIPGPSPLPNCYQATFVKEPSVAPSIKREAQP